MQDGLNGEMELTEGTGGWRVKRHYRLAAYREGSGQFRTACGVLVRNTKSTLDRREVTCRACRQSEIFKTNERLFGASG